MRLDHKQTVGGDLCQELVCSRSRRCGQLQLVSDVFAILIATRVAVWSPVLFLGDIRVGFI